ncbi:uncharacterized protein DS421_2g42860 [Arachis hypogaea]|nr:uncharacterized protein DS421_2g42860 [Arachis hypogaea]
MAARRGRGESSRQGRGTSGLQARSPDAAPRGGRVAVLPACRRQPPTPGSSAVVTPCIYIELLLLPFKKYS